MQNGHCINEKLHESGYVWSINEKAPKPPVEETSAASDSVVCHICGSENPEDALHCGNCGALFGETEQNENGNKTCAFCGKENDSDALHCKYCGTPIGAAPRFNNNPCLVGTGFAPDDLIGGMKADDIALYTQAATKKYLPKFKKIANGKKFSFNFAAFFFAPYWFFYRKMYKAGIFLVVLFASASLLLSGFSTDLINASDEYASVVYGFDAESATEEELAAFEAEFKKANDKYIAEATKPLLIISAVNLGIHFICALLADKMYYKKMKEDIRLIDEGIMDINMRKMMISRRGGLSPLAFAISVMGYSSLVQLLASGAEKIMNSF